MAWQQLHLLVARQQVEDVEDGLLAWGALSVTLADSADDPILEPGVGETPLWQVVRLTALFESDADTGKVNAHIAAAWPDLTETQHWETVDDQPWERAWMQDFEPIRCGDRLWVCPSWQPPPEPDAANLLMDPGLAFGSGTHPTTFLCLQWLDGVELAGTTVVDYGCGSGILGIAALLLGADRVIAIDNDPQALVATADNLHRNGIDPRRLTVCLPGEQAHDLQADVVVANILAEPLINLAATIGNLVRPGGQLCLSGITSDQIDAVTAAYPGFHFEPARTREGGDLCWAQLAARRLV